MLIISNPKSQFVPKSNRHKSMLSTNVPHLEWNGETVSKEISRATPLSGSRSNHDAWGSCDLRMGTKETSKPTRLSHPRLHGYKGPDLFGWTRD